MKNFIISESEKNRIIKMHKNHLFEQQAVSRFDKKYFESNPSGTINFDSNLSPLSVNGNQITDSQKQFKDFIEDGDNLKGMSGDIKYEYKFGPTMRSMGDDEAHLVLTSGGNTGTLYIIK